MGKNIDIQAYTALKERYQMAAKMGVQFGGERDVFSSLGYKVKLSYRDYYLQYIRQDIARAIIDRPVQGTWQGDIGLYESDDSEETALEKAFKELKTNKRLKSHFVRVDKLANIGHYAVLLMGLDDVKQAADWVNAVSGKNRKLLYLKPLSEESARIMETDKNPASERYGRPLYYGVTVDSKEIKVHYSRVIHIAGGLLEDEVLGTPALKPVFNRLKDLEKLVGGSAEMFWKGAFPGYHGEVDSDFDLDKETKEAIEGQVAEYQHSLRRFLISKGVKYNPLGVQVSDPKSHVDIQVQMISAVTGIPKRILTGTERGELASTSDQESWNGVLQARRLEYAEQLIVRPFVDRCIEYGILPKAKQDYVVAWSDLFAASDKEKAEVGRIRAQAVKEYASEATAEEIMPPEAFMKFMLGLDNEQIELIEEMRQSMIADEEYDQRGEINETNETGETEPVNE